jgi:MFS family permease
MDQQNNTLSAILTAPLRLFLSGEFFIRLSDMYSLFMPLDMSELGARVVDIGLVYSLAQTVPFALNILGGWFSDKYGWLRVIAWGNLLKVLVFL